MEPETSTLVEFTCEDSDNQEIPEAFKDLENIENPKSESVSTEKNKPEVDLSCFSDSPVERSRRRETIFRMFDPLYEASPESEKLDVHTKYVPCKEIIIGYKQNEETLTGTLEKSKLAAQKYEERYETLKSHAKTQLEKENKELAGMKEKHEAELSKLTTIIRRLEIENGSIQQALDQKTKECTELAQLCEEMAGPAP